MVNGAPPPTNCTSGPRCSSGTRPPMRTMAKGRPQRSASSRAFTPGPAVVPVLVEPAFRNGQGPVGVFQINHARDELAVEGQLEVVGVQLDGNRKSPLLPAWRIKPVDHLDCREYLQTLRGRAGLRPSADTREQSASPSARAPPAAGQTGPGWRWRASPLPALESQRAENNLAMVRPAGVASIQSLPEAPGPGGDSASAAAGQSRRPSWPAARRHLPRRVRLEPEAGLPNPRASGA